MKSTIELLLLPFIAALLVGSGIGNPVDAQMTCTCPTAARALDSSPEDLSSHNGPRFSNPSPTPQSPTRIAGRLGVQAGLNFPTDLKHVEILQPSFARVASLSASTSARDIQLLANEYSSRGAAMIALVDFNFDNEMPSDKDALNIGTWATVSNLIAIEYGNEPYLQPNWDYEAYARSFKIVNDAVLAANPDMTVIAAADSNEQSQRPAFQVLCALKCLGVRPRAIQNHLYGPDYAQMLAGMRIDLNNVDPTWSDMDIWVTETGLATDNGVTMVVNGVPNNYGWPTNLTYSQAADILNTSINGLLAEDNVKKVVIYKGTDDRAPGETNEREHYFGMLLAEALGNKEPLTTTAINLLNTYRLP